MKLFDFFKKQDDSYENNNNPIDYYNELLNTPDINKYSFESKYAYQEEKLLEMFGNARELYNKIRIIVITDTHNTLNEEEFKNFILNCNEYDVCLLLGDFSSNDLSIILKYINKEKIYALLGNHDNNYIEKYELNNLNGNVININGVRLLGIQGTFRYKPADFPSFSQRESLIFLNDKPEVDILVSHDIKFNSSAENDPAHQGLYGITYYLFKNSVPYHIHGHIHDSYNNDMINGTKEISTFMYEYIEL